MYIYIYLVFSDFLFMIRNTQCCVHNTQIYLIFLVEELKIYNNNNSFYVGLFNINT